LFVFTTATLRENGYSYRHEIFIADVTKFPRWQRPVTGRWRDTMAPLIAGGITMTTLQSLKKMRDHAFDG